MEGPLASGEAPGAPGFRIRVGVDIVPVERIARLAPEGKDPDRIFTAGELAYCRGKPRADEHLAARFAAKEAVFKAIGTGWSEGVTWTDVEIAPGERGRPQVKLDGKLAAYAEREGLVDVDVSLSHTSELAIAYAVVVLYSGGSQL
jgi:holo-[acyl-carrier protein] synthase